MLILFRCILFLFFLLFASSATLAIQITEVMYDPEGSDNHREYVEVDLENSTLEGITLEDLASSDTLKLAQFFNSTYALIVEGTFNYSALNVTIYTVGKTIGNGLNNNYDLILLRDNASTILDAVVYTSAIGGNGNNQSLCRSATIFSPCQPTPGKENTFNQPPFTPLSNASYDLLINEFLPDPIGLDTAPLPEGEWVEIYNAGTETVDLEGFLLADKNNRSITLSDVNFAGSSSVVQPQSYIAVYLNGKSLLNNNGFEVVQLLWNALLVDAVSYDGSREGVSWSRQENGSFVQRLPTPGQTNAVEEKTLESTMLIEKVDVGKDGVAHFGDVVYIRLKIFKGDTTKNMVKLYVANLTKQVQFQMYEKFHTYVFTFPLVLDPNCKGKYSSGTYQIIVDGFGVTATKDILVQGITTKYCTTSKEKPAVQKKEASVPTKTKPQEANICQNMTISDTFINKPGVVVYASSDTKARRYALYFFCIVLILIIGIYVFGKE